MQIGERLRQARLESGLSQRQLCADVITRNMLSQIENGSARPSMDTLRYLAERLGKPMGYFLEEQAVTSPNQQIMEKARQYFITKQYDRVLAALKQYRAPDDTFDQERYLLGALAAIEQAQAVLEDGKPDYAWELLEQAAKDGENSVYYTRELEVRRLGLCFAARPQQAAALAAQLPRHCPDTLLRAAAEKDPTRKGWILDADPMDTPRWHTLRAEAWLSRKQYRQAAEHYRKAGENPENYEKLELCYRELEDYKMAYYYACKIRENREGK